MSGFAVFDLQPTAGRILRTAAARDRLAQAYLFYGPEGTGKWAAALRTAQMALCPGALDDSHSTCPVCRRVASYNHPDVHWVVPLAAKESQKNGTDDGDDVSAPATAQQKEWLEILAVKTADPWAALEFPRRPYITMKRIREVQSILSRTPAEGPRKVAIMINVEAMRPDAQSVLLKTIEEPPPNTHLILTAGDKSVLLPTILSRCQPVRFLPLPQKVIVRRLIDEIGIDECRAQRAVELCGGGWTRARTLATEEWELWRQAADALLAGALGESTDELIRAIDTVFKRRPELGKVTFLFDVWQAALHRMALAGGVGQAAMPPMETHDAVKAVAQCRIVLDDARAAILGNVTPRTAVAAALLQVREELRGHVASLPRTKCGIDPGGGQDAGFS